MLIIRNNELKFNQFSKKQIITHKVYTNSYYDKIILLLSSKDVLFCCFQYTTDINNLCIKKMTKESSFNVRKLLTPSMQIINKFK